MPDFLESFSSAETVVLAALQSPEVPAKFGPEVTRLSVSLKPLYLLPGWEEGTPTEELPPSDCAVGRSVWAFS